MFYSIAKHCIKYWNYSKTLCLCGLICAILTGCDNTNLSGDLGRDIKTIETLHNKVKTVENDSTLVYLKMADNLIIGNSNIPDSLILENTFLKGLYFKKIKQLDSATYYFHKTTDKIDISSISPREIEYFKQTLSNDLITEKSLNNGIDIANKFIKGLQNTENYGALVYPFNYLERVNRTLGKPKEALFYNEKSQQAAKRSGDRNTHAATVIGSTNLLYSYFNKKNEAFIILDSLLRVKPSFSNDVYRQLHTNYGILSFYESDFKQAILHYKKAAYFLRKEVAHPEYYYFLVENHINLSEGYMELKEYDMAKTYLDSASANISKDSRFDNIVFMGEQRIKLSLLMNDNIDNLLNEYNKLTSIHNAFYNEKIKDEFIALNTAKENEKVLANQNKEVELANQSLRFQFILILILSILFSIIGYLIYRQRRFKFEKESLQLHQRLLSSQMNPHFTSNILYNIQNQIKSDQKSAIAYMLKFSRLLRLVLENSTQNYIQLEKELESIRKYMDLQLFRFPTKFTYDIILENMEENDLLFIPPMLIQPFIENSIEHGFSDIDYQGKINIKLVKQNKYVNCIIEDNGIGYNTSKKSNKESFSTKLISEFILRTTKTKVNISNKKNTNNKPSTIVDFYIPFKDTEDD